jgi:hypothetical protein
MDSVFGAWYLRDYHILSLFFFFLNLPCPNCRSFGGKLHKCSDRPATDVPPVRIWIRRGLGKWVRFTFSGKAKEWNEKAEIAGSSEHGGSVNERASVVEVGIWLE